MIQPDEIIRSSRKTIAVSVDSLGKVTVRAPKRCDDKRIFSFLQQHEDWILRQKAKMQGAGVQLPSEDLEGYALQLLGKPYRICLYEGKEIRLDNEQNLLFLPKENAQERLVRWLKGNAKRILTALTESTAKTMQTTFCKVRISSAKTRWGSCSGKDVISYSFRLIYAPKEVVEYVVVHELAHTKHKNHSKAFWEEVARFAPDYKLRRKWLKEKGALMHIF